jgi:Ca2+/Na+ antiporter
MYELISGAIMLACFVIGIFFIKFWKKTHDKLFIMFAIAFWILSIERLVLGAIGTQHELGPKVYLIRLSSFIMILFAIIQKNREADKN